MISSETRNRIEAVLKKKLGPDYVGAEIEARPDHDGDPAIFIAAKFAPPDAIPAVSTIVEATVALRDALLANEDSRLPYLSPVYPPDPVSDEAA